MIDLNDNFESIEINSELFGNIDTLNKLTTEYLALDVDTNILSLNITAEDYEEVAGSYEMKLVLWDETDQKTEYSFEIEFTLSSESGSATQNNFLA